jgi:hypothetical protein
MFSSTPISNHLALADLRKDKGKKGLHCEREVEGHRGQLEPNKMTSKKCGTLLFQYANYMIGNLFL